MFRTANAVLKTLCNLRLLRGSYLAEYSTKATKMVYGHEMMRDGVTRKLILDRLRSEGYYVEVHGTLDFLSRRQGPRVVCLDRTAHYGDVTLAAFYQREHIFTISLHGSVKTLYPWAGFEDEIN